jgi:hypothetical protein
MEIMAQREAKENQKRAEEEEVRPNPYTNKEIDL